MLKQYSQTTAEYACGIPRASRYDEASLSNIKASRASLVHSLGLSAFWLSMCVVHAEWGPVTTNLIVLDLRCDVDGAIHLLCLGVFWEASCVVCS